MIADGPNSTQTNNDWFARFFKRLPPYSVLVAAGASIGLVGAVGLYVLKIDAFALGLPITVLMASLAGNKWRIEHGIPPHRLYRWYWAAIAYLLGAVAYGVGVYFVLT